MSGFNFGELDLTDVAADDGPPKRFLEVGNHDVRIKEAMIKETAARTGRYLEVTFADENDMTIVERYNVQNPNPKAVQIGKSQLKAMLEASNHPDANKPGDADKLSGYQVRINVGLGKENNEGKRWPEVKSYEKSQALVEAVASTDDDEIPF